MESIKLNSIIIISIVVIYINFILGTVFYELCLIYIRIINGQMNNNKYLHLLNN